MKWTTLTFYFLVSIVHEVCVSRRDQGYLPRADFNTNDNFLTALLVLRNSGTLRFRSTISCSRDTDDACRQVSTWSWETTVSLDRNVQKLFRISLSPLCVIYSCSRNLNPNFDAAICQKDWTHTFRKCYSEEDGIQHMLFDYTVTIFDAYGDPQATLSQSHSWLLHSRDGDSSIQDELKVAGSVNTDQLTVNDECFEESDILHNLTWHSIYSHDMNWKPMPYHWYDWLVPLYGEAVRYVSRLNNDLSDPLTQSKLTNQQDFRFPVAVANLEKRKDKKSHMIQLLDELGFSNVSFPEATPASKISLSSLLEDGLITASAVEYLEENEYIGKKAALSYLANAVDQVRLISEAALNGYPLFAVFEDDLIPATNLSATRERIRNALAALPPTADMLYLEACFEMCDSVAYSPLAPYVVRAFSPGCSAAIVFTAKGASKVADFCMPVFGGIDTMYPQLIKEGKLEAYIANPVAFFQDAFWGSDVVRDQTYRWEDFARSRGRTHAILSPLCWEAEDMVDNMVMQTGLVLERDSLPLLAAWGARGGGGGGGALADLNAPPVLWADGFLQPSPLAHAASLLRSSDGAIYVLFRAPVAEWALSRPAWRISPEGHYVGFYTEDVDTPGVFKVEIGIWSDAARNPVLTLPTWSLCWGLAHQTLPAPPCPVEVLLVSPDGAEADAVRRYLFFDALSANLRPWDAASPQR